MAAATHDPSLAKAADAAFIHAMHVGALWTAGFALIGAVVLVLGFRPARRTPPPAPARPAPLATSTTSTTTS
ncbi:hypothetical protein [Streptomyces katrae]|uniref:hypothetical protein n=1 Tax=Streptomyces katrae TaxID=68223 RepID=UPI0004C0ECC0|nr:hypothetical protein [Streptomyces katrae]